MGCVLVFLQKRRYGFRLLICMFPQIYLKNGEKYLESEIKKQNNFFHVDATLTSIYNFQMRHPS